MFSKYYGGLSCYNDHSNDGNNDHDDDECIMENRDKEENFSYLWQKGIGDRRHTCKYLIVIWKQNNNNSNNKSTAVDT